MDRRRANHPPQPTASSAGIAASVAMVEFDR